MWLFRLILLLLLSFPALAQEWPARLVKFVSPYPPGGSVDPLARILAAKLAESLKQQFIVENRTGASGIIGTDYVAKSAPDGYTFVFIFDTHAAHQALHVRGGKMRALVLTGDKRSHTMPDVPTLREQGIDVVAHAWWGILAPAGTPRPIIDKFAFELHKALNLPDVKKMLGETLGMDVVALGPEATHKWIVEQIARWGKVVRENNIRTE